MWDSFKEFAGPQVAGYAAGAVIGKYISEAQAVYAAIKAESGVVGATAGTRLPVVTDATATSPYSSSGTSYGKTTITDVNGNPIATQPTLPGATGGVTAIDAAVATGSPITTRFVNGVTVVDRQTGAVFNGTVDLQSTFDRIAAGATGLSRNDGSVFRNGQSLLPSKPPGYYTEYVVPTPGINGPGPQRIVTGQNGEMFYTPDHYLTFVPVKKP